MTYWWHTEHHPGDQTCPSFLTGPRLARPGWWVGPHDSHVDPLLQRVLQVLLADGVREGPQRRLERDDGRGQVSEPAAEPHLSLQDTGALP